MNEHNMNEQVPGFNDRRAMLAGIGGIAAGAILAGRAQAGPLDPPPGPIVPTGKTLTEVEPRIAINSTNTPGDADSMFKITQPGSYYLTGNITGVAGKHGIEIVTSDVSIDLNGFALLGAPGTLDGIRLSAPSLTNIAVRDGTATGWGQDGIDLGSGTNCVLTRIRASANGDRGIAMSNYNSISLCVALDNGSTGIRAVGGNTITDCVSSSNTGPGISGGFSNTISRCTVSYNAGTGIEAGFGARIDACNATYNQGDGFSTESESLITGSYAALNSGVGFLIGSGGSISACNAADNDVAGISAGSNAHITNNACVSNDGTGILITGSDNRVNGNHCTDNAIGVIIDAGGNYIVRNTCAGNTILSWSISANNYYGPIINRSGINTAAVNGNFAPSTLSSTDPHANFTY